MESATQCVLNRELANNALTAPICSFHTRVRSIRLCRGKRESGGLQISSRGAVCPWRSYQITNSNNSPVPMQTERVSEENRSSSLGSALTLEMTIKMEAMQTKK
jgi:hypothetical protein